MKFYSSAFVFFFSVSSALVSYSQAKEIKPQKKSTPRSIAQTETGRPLQICYFSHNIEDERILLEKFVKKIHATARIKVVEAITSPDVEVMDSLKKMINSGTRCDGLVFSGHHSGDFFGDRSNGGISIEELEELSCDPKAVQFFYSVRSLWLQGCNTLGNTLTQFRSERMRNADGRAQNIFRQLERDGGEQSLFQLSSELSATLDQGNPLGSRYLRVFPQAHIFGWDDVAPSDRDDGEYALLFHISNVAHLLKNVKAKYDSPKEKVISPASQKVYREALDALLDPDSDKLAKSEKASTQGWEWAGKGASDVTKKGYFGILNPAAKSLESMISKPDPDLASARLFHCEFKKESSCAELKKGLNTGFSTPKRMGLNLNTLIKRVQELDLSSDSKHRQTLACITDWAKQKVEIKDYLLKEMNLKHVGIARKIDFAHSYAVLFRTSLQKEISASLRAEALSYLGSDKTRANEVTQSFIVETLEKAKLINVETANQILLKKKNSLPISLILLKAAQSFSKTEDRLKLMHQVLDANGTDHKVLHSIDKNFAQDLKDYPKSFGRYFEKVIQAKEYFTLISLEAKGVQLSDSQISNLLSDKNSREQQFLLVQAIYTRPVISDSLKDTLTQFLSAIPIAVERIDDWILNLDQKLASADELQNFWIGTRLKLKLTSLWEKYLALKKWPDAIQVAFKNAPLNLRTQIFFSWCSLNNPPSMNRDLILPMQEIAFIETDFSNLPAVFSFQACAVKDGSFSSYDERVQKWKEDVTLQDRFTIWKSAQNRGLRENKFPINEWLSSIKKNVLQNPNLYPFSFVELIVDKEKVTSDELEQSLGKIENLSEEQLTLLALREDFKFEQDTPIAQAVLQKRSSFSSLSGVVKAKFFLDSPHFFLKLDPTLQNIVCTQAFADLSNQIDVENLLIKLARIQDVEVGQKQVFYECLKLSSSANKVFNQTRIGELWLEKMKTSSTTLGEVRVLSGLLSVLADSGAYPLSLQAAVDHLYVLAKVSNGFNTEEKLAISLAFQVYALVYRSRNYEALTREVFMDERFSITTKQNFLLVILNNIYQPGIEQGYRSLFLQLDQGRYATPLHSETAIALVDAFSNYYQRNKTRFNRSPIEVFDRTTLLVIPQALYDGMLSRLAEIDSTPKPVPTPNSQ